eukprot:126013_1
MKLKEIAKYLSDAHKLHLNAMIVYYNEFQFDHDHIYLDTHRRGRDRDRQRDRNNRNRDRSRSRNRSEDLDVKLSELSSTFPLQTLHDLCRRVHCCALYGPTKWRKVLGKRHLRILYDILIDPLIATKTKINGFLLHERGRTYLNALE